MSNFSTKYARACSCPTWSTPCTDSTARLYLSHRCSPRTRPGEKKTEGGRRILRTEGTGVQPGVHPRYGGGGRGEAKDHIFLDRRADALAESRLDQQICLTKRVGPHLQGHHKDIATRNARKPLSPQGLTRSRKETKRHQPLKRAAHRYPTPIPKSHSPESATRFQNCGHIFKTPIP